MEQVVILDRGSLSNSEVAFRSLLAEQIKAPLKVTWAEVCVLLEQRPRWRFWQSAIPVQSVPELKKRWNGRGGKDGSRGAPTASAVQ